MSDDDSISDTLKGWWGKLAGTDEEGIGETAAEAAQEAEPSESDEDASGEQSGYFITDAVEDLTDLVMGAPSRISDAVREFGESDPDGDNLSTADEFAHGTNPWDRDTDGDLRSDRAEIHGGKTQTVKTNPLDKDTDNDGLNDSVEILVTHTDPTDPDTDDDTWGDGQ